MTAVCTSYHVTYLGVAVFTAENENDARNLAETFRSALRSRPHSVPEGVEIVKLEGLRRVN